MSPVTLQSRSQTTSPRTRIRGAHGNAWHVRARLGRHARLSEHAVRGPVQLSWATQGCVSTFKVPAACLKSGAESCACGTVSQVHALPVKPDGRARAPLVYLLDQQAEGDRSDAQIVVPTKDLEKEPPPAHTRPIHVQRMAISTSRVSWQRPVGASTLRTTCQQHGNLIWPAAGGRRPGS